MRISNEFKRILVAVDGSEESMAAADYAISIAAKEKTHSELFLLHVVPSEIKFGHSSGLFGIVPPKFREHMEQEADRWFAKIKAKAANTGGITISTEVISTGASPQVAIVEYAERINTDLIVVGTRGMSGVKKMLLGSVASGVLTYSHCPVLVVK